MGHCDAPGEPSSGADNKGLGQTIFHVFRICRQSIGALWTELARVPESAPLREGSRPASTTKTQIEQALLAVDLFPRAAVFWLIFGRRKRNRRCHYTGR